MPYSSGIPLEERVDRISRAYIACISNANFNTLGIKNFANFCRLVYIDSAALPQITFNYEDSNFHKVYEEFRDKNKDLDGNLNFGYHMTKPLFYLKKHHPLIYESLLPWIMYQIPWIIYQKENE